MATYRTHKSTSAWCPCLASWHYAGESRWCGGSQSDTACNAKAPKRVAHDWSMVSCKRCLSQRPSRS